MDTNWGKYIMDAEVTSKAATDPILLKSLAKQGIDAQEVEFVQDYAPRYDPVTGAYRKEHSPYAKFYRHRKTNKRFMVVSGLPKVKAKGRKIEAGWLWAKNKYYSKANLFSAVVEGRQIKLTCLSDQPDGTKKNDSVTWLPQLFLNNEEVSPIAETAVLLETDPTNENYQQNVLEWDYGICRRRVRIIEGRLRERWVFFSNPSGDVLIRHNFSGSLKPKLGQFAINDDEEYVPRDVFDNPSEYDLKYPVEISASATYYPDADPETTSVDGRAAFKDDDGESWATAEGHAGSDAEDDVSSQFAAGFRADGNTDEWDRLFRGIYLFDTSGLDDSYTLTAVTFSVAGGGKYDEGSNSPEVNVYSSAPASNTALAAGDYDSLGTTAYCDSAIAYADWTTDGSYNDFSFNATGIAAVSKTGITKLGLREAKFDVGAATPTWGAGENVGFTGYFSEQGTGYQPKLVVTYTIPETTYDTMVGSPTSWAWEKCDYDGAEKCPVGSETSWAWEAPSDGGADKTPQGSPTSFSWGNE